MLNVPEIPTLVQSHAATICALRGRLEEAIRASADAHNKLWSIRHSTWQTARIEYAVVLAARVHAARMHLAALEAEQALDAVLAGATHG